MQVPRAVTAKPSQPNPAEVTANLINASESDLGWIPWQIMKMDRGKWCCFLPVVVTTPVQASCGLLWPFPWWPKTQWKCRMSASPVHCPHLRHFADNHCYRIQSCLRYRETATCLLNYINHIQHDRLLLLSFKRFSKASCLLPHHNSSRCFSSVTFPGPPPTASPGSS